MKENIFGHDHPEVAKTFYWIANTNMAMGNYHIALLMSQKAINIRKNISLADDHPDLVNTVKQLKLIEAKIAEADNTALLLDNSQHDTSFKITEAVGASRVEAVITQAIIIDKEYRSKEISQAILDRAKVLLQANSLESADVGLEIEFTNELSKALRTTYRTLLETTEKNNDLKIDLIDNLASQFKISGKLTITNGKFTINEICKEGRDNFLDPEITEVKEILKNKNYYDEISNVKLEII